MYMRICVVLGGIRYKNVDSLGNVYALKSNGDITCCDVRTINSKV